MPINKWVKKMWYVCVKLNIAVKKKGILSFATAQMDLEIIMLNGAIRQRKTYTA